MFTAEDARALVATGSMRKFHATIDMIKYVAAQGGTHCKVLVVETLREFIEEELKELGYTVQEVHSEESDKTCLRIDWEEIT